MNKRRSQCQVCLLLRRKGMQMACRSSSGNKAVVPTAFASAKAEADKRAVLAAMRRDTCCLAASRTITSCLVRICSELLRKLRLVFDLSSESVPFFLMRNT